MVLALLVDSSNVGYLIAIITYEAGEKKKSRDNNKLSIQTREHQRRKG
jgi:hypothetical protein